MEEIRVLNVYLNEDNQKVGVITKENSNFIFKYDPNYKSNIYFLMPEKRPNSLFCKDYKVDVSEVFTEKNEIFLEISDNFPEGYNLDYAIRCNGYNPHHLPLNFLYGVKNDGIFYFEK